MRKNIGQLLEKFGLKKQGLRVYFSVTNGWKDLIDSSRKKLIPMLVSRRSGNGFYAIDLDSDWLGLGARIVKTLEILLYCEEKGLFPLIRFNYLEKGRTGADYFKELFTRKQTDKEGIANARFTSIRDIDELGWPEDYNKKLKLQFAGSMFDRYFSIDAEIIAEVDEFYNYHFKGQKVLGVHYRGTDKAGEAPLVAKGYLLDRIKTILAERAFLQILFLSTDDAAIIHFLRDADLPVPVLFRRDAVRSDDGDQFHRKKEISKSIVNRDAIVNLLLLSRCDFLLKTASILSDCSVIFNPSIEVTLISKPHSEALTLWPCTEIIANQRSQ